MIGKFSKLGIGTDYPLDLLHLQDLADASTRFDFSKLPWQAFNGIIADLHTSGYGGLHLLTNENGCIHFFAGTATDQTRFELDFDMNSQSFRIRVGGETNARPPIVARFNKDGTLDLPMLEWENGVSAGTTKRLAVEHHLGQSQAVTSPRCHLVMSSGTPEHIWDLTVKGRLYHGKVIDLRFVGRYGGVWQSKDLWHDDTIEITHGHYQASDGSYVAWFEPHANMKSDSYFTVDSAAGLTCELNTAYRAPASNLKIVYTSEGVEL